MLKDFRDFLTKTNALALAVGVIIGAATGKVVSSVVDDVLMPIIGLVLPGGDWRDAKIVLSSATAADGTITENAITYGHLFGSIIDFIIIAFVIYMIMKALLRPAPAAPAEPTKKCPFCLEIIPAAATRCRACGSEVK